MSEQPQDIRQWIQELVSRSAKDQIQNLQRLEELMRRATAGDIDQNVLRSEYLRFARQESTRYINDLTRVGLSFYNTILELNKQYNDRFFQQAYQQPTAPPAHGLHQVRSDRKKLRGVIVASDEERDLAVEDRREPLEDRPLRSVPATGGHGVVAVGDRPPVVGRLQNRISPVHLPPTQPGSSHAIGVQGQEKDRVTGGKRLPERIEIPR